MSLYLENFEDFCHVFGQWGGQFHQMSRGLFQGRAHIVSGHIVRVFQVETNQAILTRGMDASSYATFIPITPRNEATLWRGRRLSTGQLIAKSPDIEYYNQTSPDTIIRALLVPVEVVRDVTRVLTGDDLDGRYFPWTAPCPLSDTMHRFQQGLSRLLTLSIRSSGFLADPEGLALEHECLRRLVECLVDPATERRDWGGHRSRPKLVERAVDLMREKLRQPLSALDLCSELEVGDRTLRRAFGETFGLGPIAYHRVMRLNAVRRALRQARGSGEAVASLARRWGFPRLGSFAAEYRQLFGELPSETLGVRGWPGVQQVHARVDPPPLLLSPGDKAPEAGF